MLRVEAYPCGRPFSEQTQGTATANRGLTTRFKLFGRSGIDHPLDFGNAVGREAAFLGMLQDHFLVGSNVDTVDLVFGHVTLDPLDRGAKFVQNAAGLLGNCLHVLGADVPAPGISLSITYLGIVVLPSILDFGNPWGLAEKSFYQPAA